MCYHTEFQKNLSLQIGIKSENNTFISSRRIGCPMKDKNSLNFKYFLKGPSEN